MKNTASNIPELLSEYQDLELQAHVSLDDVISKVTQEVSELSEAFEALDSQESEKEAADAIINILSASSKLGGLPSDFDESGAASEGAALPEGAQLLRMLGKWNQTVQALRGRYSRNSPTAADLSVITRSLVSGILLHAGRDQTIEGIIEGNIAKFKSRIDAYKSDISLDDHVWLYPDFPKKGIMFRDISPILASPEAMRHTAFELAYKCRHADVIAGLDARGFLFGLAVAELLGKPFVMIRKKGKLPGETVGVDYSLEYGDNSIEMQKDAIAPGQKVAIIDDLLATGGTFAAAASLVEKVGGQVDSLLSVIALDEPFLLSHPVRQSLAKYRNESLLRYE